mmetsp:Transcript_5394/g.13491  ORF Transcript_5394/g.13491 Transcript_5394/m.13491 type:complete len:212 (+) Transcript_5394:961-1596(+)
MRDMQPRHGDRQRYDLQVLAALLQGRLRLLTLGCLHHAALHLDIDRWDRTARASAGPTHRPAPRGSHAPRGWYVAPLHDLHPVPRGARRGAAGVAAERAHELWCAAHTGVDPRVRAEGSPGQMVQHRQLKEDDLVRVGLHRRPPERYPRLPLRVLHHGLRSQRLRIDPGPGQPPLASAASNQRQQHWLRAPVSFFIGIAAKVLLLAHASDV